MPTCDMGYAHDLEAAAEPVEVPVPVETGPNEHDVEIAAIEAEASVTREEIRAGVDVAEQETRIGALEGELRGVRETLDRLAPPAPEPEAEPVVTVVPDPPAPVETGPAAPPETPPPPKQKKSTGWWDAYQ